jgi:hypothetical protein
LRCNYRAAIDEKLRQKADGQDRRLDTITSAAEEDRQRISALLNNAERELLQAVDKVDDKFQNVCADLERNFGEGQARIGETMVPSVIMCSSIVFDCSQGRIDIGIVFDCSQGRIDIGNLLPLICANLSWH